MRSLCPPKRQTAIYLLPSVQYTCLYSSETGSGDLGWGFRARHHYAILFDLICSSDIWGRRRRSAPGGGGR